MMPTPSNSKSNCQTIEDERAERQKTAEEPLKYFRTILPTLLKRLSKIEDPRQPKKIKHKLTVLLVYGLLIFVFQMASRREANRVMTMACFKEHLQLLFPGLETLPHGDTLYRLLTEIDVNEIEAALLELVKHLIRNKKFQRYLLCNHYMVAIDGTQKLKRDYPWTDKCLRKQSSSGDYYYVYVLEASLVFPNGLTLPLMSEFLEYPETNPEKTKQDCELNAFKRLATRLKKCFPQLRIRVLLDGLYANGPAMALCRQYRWEFMIVLQDESLRSVWQEAQALRELQPDQTLDYTWGNRRQHFWWVNHINYCYGPDSKEQLIHVVVGEETWEEFDPKTNAIVTRHSRHAWLSSQPLSKNNVTDLCNLGARHRWGIEHNILVEKHYGYQYEHCFASNWNAMKGYHFLMRLAHLINSLAFYSVYFFEMVSKKGAQGLIKYIGDTLSGPWLDPEKLRALHSVPVQLRLI